MTSAPGSPTAPALATRAGVVGPAALLLLALVGVAPASAHGAAAEPTWGQVAASAPFARVEPRTTVPDVEDDLTDRAVLAPWVVPVVADGQDVPLVGELGWTRTAVAAAQGGRGIPWPNVLLAVAGVAAVAALLLVRRGR